MQTSAHLRFNCHRRYSHEEPVNTTTTKVLTIHKNATSEHNPTVMIPCSTISSAEVPLMEHTVKGEWFRVIPKTAQDIIRLHDLDHHVDKHTPAHGDGILISARAMAALIVIDIRSQREHFFA